MIFKIADGRECFYQWDIDRQIIVSDPTIKEVHFCNRTDDCSLVVPVEDLEIFADSKVISVLRTANVPNRILQNSYAIRVFGYDGKATLHEATFEVKARTRPADYVYTEEQEYTIEAYIERAVEEAKATGNFQGDTGPKGDKGDKGDTGEAFTYDMFTEEQLEALRGPEGKQGPIGPQGERGEKGEKGDKGDTGRTGETGPTGPRGPKGDTGEQGPKGDKGDTPDLTGYATETYVDEAIAAIEIPEAGEMNNVVIIDNTATRKDIKAITREGKWPVFCKDPKTSNPHYYPLVEQNGEYYRFGTIYKNTYYAIQYDGYKEAWGSPEAKVISGGSADLSNYYTKSEVDELIPEPTDLTGYATEKYVDDAIAGIEIPEGGESVDLSDYYTKEETYSKAEVDGLIPDLTGYATEQYVDDAIASIEIPEVEPVDLTNYYTKDETYSKTEVDEAIAGIETGGSEVKEIFCLDMTKATSTASGKSFTQEIKDFVTYWKANGNKRPVFVNGVTGYKGWVPVEVYYDSTIDRFTLTPLVNIAGFKNVLQGSDYSYNTFILKCTDETYYKSAATIVGIQSSSGSDWKFTDDRYYWELYQAKEVYIKFYSGSGSKTVFSHLVLPEGETLGNNFTAEDIMFTEDSRVELGYFYWRYDGSQIDFYYDDNSILYDMNKLVIAYKV